MNNRKAPNSFAARMKGYETVARNVLMPRTPVIVRVDGKNFSKLTRGMEKPFDHKLLQCMEAAAIRLCKEAQNLRLAFMQSDEISLLLTDFRTLNTEPWFKNQVQKICSVSAAMATAGFSELFCHLFPDRVRPGNLPVFDARCFNLPREEVNNYFVWRQRDATRNSVAMAAQAQFSQKELQGAGREQMMDMLMLQKGINWNDYPVPFKRGAVFTRERVDSGVAGAPARAKWMRSDAPIFGRDKDFVEKFLREEEDRV